MLIRKSFYAAALLLAFATASPVFASIDYTPLNQILPNDVKVAFDLNHDGAPDFYLKSSAILEACGMTREGLSGSAKISSARSTSQVILNGDFAAALPAGVTVGASRTFSPGSIYLMSFYTCGGGGVAGNWLNVSNHYLGVQFTIGGLIHYGWIELSVNATRTELTTVVVGFAYETVVGKSIVTGQTGTPSACALPSTDQTVHICAPAAGSTVSSPVTISARARWDNHTIHHMRIYIDSVDSFDVTSPVDGAIKTTLALSPGSHHLTVTAWDSSGQSIHSGETFTSK
jgi:hypothetical protein